MSKFSRRQTLVLLIFLISLFGGALVNVSNAYHGSVSARIASSEPMSQSSPNPQQDMIAYANVPDEWDRSSVSVSGACVAGVPTFSVSNTGTEGMTGATTWRLVDANGTVLLSGTIQLAGRETQTLTFPDYADQTVRLYVDQRPGHPGNSNPNDVVEKCGDISTPTSTPDVTAEPTVDVTPEPTVDVTPEPTVDVTPEPTVDVTPEPTVDVTPEPTVDITPEPLILDSLLVCTPDGVVTFNLSVLQGAMADGESYEVQVIVNGEIVYSEAVYNLNMDNPTATFEFSDYSGQIVTVTVVGLDELTKTVECWDQSSILVEAVCFETISGFYISNIGSGFVTGEVAWYLLDADNNLLTSGTVFVTSGDPQILFFPEYSNQQLYLDVDQRPGFVGDDYSYAFLDACEVVITPEPTGDVTPEPTADVTPDITPDPTEDVTPVPLVLDSSLVCSADGIVTYTIFVVEGAMGDGEGYEVQAIVNGEVVYGDSVYGLNMDNATAVFELGYFSGQTVTFTVVGLDGLTKTVECVDNSNIVVESACVDGVSTFTIFNIGAPMTGEVAWYLMDANNNVLTTGTIFINEGETPVLTFPEYSDQLLYLDVNQRPGFVGDDYSYAVIDACIIPTEEPTVDVTPEPTVEVTPEPTPTSTPDVTPEPTPTNTPDVTPEPTPTSTPEPVDFVSSLICLNNGNAIFTVTYTGGGAMAQGESYVVSYTTDDLTDADTDDTFTVVGAVTRLSQSKPTATFTVRRMSGETVTFMVDGLEPLTATIDCWDKSSVSVDGACVGGVPTFYVNNTGSEAMTGDTTWRLIDEQTGTILTSGTIRLGGNDTQLLTFEQYAGLNIRLIVDQRPGHPGSSQPNDSLNNCASS